MEHKEENRICQNCKSEFIIEPDDFSFYEKIKVPPPTFCPECRLVRKLVWRNERSLYKRKCDLCKAEIISMYKPEVEFPVFCSSCWWSDKWDPLSYGANYDFKIPFFEQFKQLQEKVPRIASYSNKNIGSEYCNYTSHMKNSYLVFGSWFSEDCSYGQTVMSSKNCWDCIFVRDCEICFNCIDCTKSNMLLYSQKCSSCIDSAFLYDCRNCQNCLFSYNLRNKSYYIFNKKVSREEFLETKQKIFSSNTELENAIELFKEMVKAKAVHKFMTGENNQNVSGEFISNSKNVHHSYYIDKGENEKYAVRGGVGQKDAMDVFGVHAGELVYESNNIDLSSRCLFSINGENNINSNYLIDSDSVSNCFGCISVRKSEYCILNKKYSKEEYEEILPKIIKQMGEVPYIDSMGKIYKYGEFFPMELCVHSYNETLAQEYIPINRLIAGKFNYKWDIVSEKNYIPTKSWIDLPENIDEVSDSIISEIILCKAWDLDKEAAQNHKCTKAFKITKDEISMYKRLKVPLPRKCPNTRYFEMFKQRNLVSFWYRKCMREGCNNEFETSYSPDRKEIVYCEKCYQQEVY